MGVRLIVTLCVVGVYLWLAIELLAFSVPSVASTWRILRKDADRADATELARSYRRPTWQKFLLYLVPTGLGVLLFLIPLVWILLPSMRGLFIPMNWAESSAVALCGAVIALGGRAISFSAALSIRRGHVGMGELADLSELAASGLYAKSRNPILLGTHVTYVGLVMACPSAVFALGFPFFVGNMHVRVRLEESHLKTEFGAVYTAYCDRTRRYLPF